MSRATPARNRRRQERIGVEALPPIVVVDLFPGERDSLLRLLGGLSAAQWATPTVCPGWSVHDVALHLLGVDIANLSRRRDRFDAPGFATPGTDLARWEHLVAAINRWNEGWVGAARRISPRLLCDLLRFTGAALHEYFAGLDLAALGGPVSWAGPDPAPVWLDIAREYTERWVHQQQIRDAVRQPGLTERRWLAPVLDTFARALPHTLRGVAAPEGASVRLVIAGDAGGEWVAVRANGAWALTADAGPAPDAAVTLDQDVAWRLFTKGLSKERALRHARREGDPTLAGKVLEMVSVIA
jgi:uncharacterized protein (TIGR03083 family)